MILGNISANQPESGNGATSPRHTPHTVQTGPQDAGGRAMALRSPWHPPLLQSGEANVSGILSGPGYSAKLSLQYVVAEQKIVPCTISYKLLPLVLPGGLKLNVLHFRLRPTKAIKNEI